MAGQGSARVTLREIDLSQVRNPQQLPQGVPAAVVGPARKGPAFVPQTFANMQQFNEVFGNMLEVGREGNSNQFGPLALNEWMKNAQAGTYIRVLGVGDGLPSTGGKVTDAGFVVGERQLQEQSSGPAKVGDNEHAAITDSTAALALGRTHMLGCFMKDSTGSNYLKDAGMEAEGSAASLVIEFTEKPSHNDTFVLDVVDNQGDLIGAYTVTFVNGAAGENQVQIDNGGNTVLAVMQELEALLDAEFNANIVTTTEDISLLGEDPGTRARMTITSGNPAQLDSTNDCVVKFNLNNADTSVFSVGDKTGSTTNETFNFAQTGGSGARCVISITDVPDNASSIALTSLVNDNLNGLTDALVTYTFTDAAIAAGANKEAGRWHKTNNDAVSIDASAGKTKKDVLANLKAALDRAASNHLGKFATSLSDSGLSLTVTQLQKGEAGRSRPSDSGANILLANTTNLSVRCADANDGVEENTPITNNAESGFFFGGENGSETSLTITLSGLPNSGDNLEFRMLDGSNQLQKENFKFSSFSSGTEHSDSVAATATLSTDGNGNIAHGLTAGQKITLTSQSGTVVDYFVSDTEAGGEAHLTPVVDGVTVLTNGTTATLTDGADRGILVGIVAATTQNGFLALLKAAIEHASGHNGEITVSADAADAAEVQSRELTQSRTGRKGNTEITEDLGTISKSDFTGGLRVLNIQLGVDLQETLYNLRNALLSNTTEFSNSLLAATVSDQNDSVKISAVEGVGSLRSVLKNVVNVSDVALFSNPVGQELTGNFGEKSENFSGGGGAATPVIRGVLMTPQGVRATLDVNDQLTQFSNRSSDFTNVKRVSDTDLRSAAHDKSFGSTPTSDLAGYVVGEVDSSQGFKLILNGYSNLQNPAVLSCSFDPDSPSYFAKVLNTDPTKMEELGHYLYANWDIKSEVAAPSNVGLRNQGGQITGNLSNMIGFLVTGSAGRNQSDEGKPDYEDFSSRYATAKTPWIVSQFYGAGSNISSRPASASAGDALKLFRLHSLDDGAVSNGQFRLLISNLRYGGLSDYGSFDMSLESFASDPIRGNVIASWKNANLDPDSRNFIGRLIGDMHMYYDFESDLGKQRLRQEGQYARKNPYVRIELSNALKQGDIPVDALPTGFQGHAHLYTKSNGNFLELDVADADKIFTAVGNTPTETLSQAQVAPLDFVTSINRDLLGVGVSSTSLEADDDLAWGVKFALRENPFTKSVNVAKGHKELSEQVFNESIASWAKFFPSFGDNSAWVTDGDLTDNNQNSFFSLEKIEIPKSSLTIQNSDGVTVADDDEISSWNGAVYQRLSSTVPVGRFVKISQDALGRNSRYLKFRCMFQGGFDGVNIFDEEKAQLSGVASLREGEDETSSQKFTGPTIMSYQRAIDVLSDKSATEFQLLALPGQRTSRISDYAITACEERFDALYVMDIVTKDALGQVIEDQYVKPHVRQTIGLFADRALDTSFAAAYFPDVVVRRPSDNAPLVVPPSVGMLGVMSRNDSIADPWFAPAGLNRGRLSAIDSQVQMNRDLLDELYDADINPIYVPAGRSGEVYAFGQKTLLQDASALDRINVRRLLIDIRRKVKKVGERLLFEPNRASTLARFSSLVEPIMANVQQRRGVTRYKVQIDSSTTTQNDIENNTIRGKIYLQPTKSVEFISLDFVVTNTIQQ